MKTNIIKINEGKIPKKEFDEVISLLVQGEPVIFPTDTVYGIGTNAFKPHGVKKIYDLKQRDEKKPLVWLMHSIDAIDRYVQEIKAAVRVLMERFWPGALTIIFTASPEACRQGLTEKTIGIRIPGHTLLRDLIAGAGVPLATTSANQSGSMSPTSFSQCAYFLDKLPCMLDEGVLPSVKESTIIDGRHAVPHIIREGAISRAQIEDAIKI